MSFFQGAKVLVTGGTGFVGINLILRLLPLQAQVRAAVHVKEPVIDDIKKRMDKNDWQESLNCFFDPAVRNTLEAVQAMMEK